MCKLDHKEDWVPKNWCFWIVVLEKTLESLMDCKEIKPVNTKGNESWIFIGGTDAEAEAPIFKPPDVKSRLTGKDPDDGKDWRHEEKGTTENEIVGWHHWLNGHEFKQVREMLKDREAWHCAIHGVVKSRTYWLTDWTTVVALHWCVSVGCRIKWITYMYIKSFSFGFLSHLVHHRKPNRVPYTVCSLNKQYSIRLNFSLNQMFHVTLTFKSYTNSEWYIWMWQWTLLNRISQLGAPFPRDMRVIQWLLLLSWNTELRLKMQNPGRYNFGSLFLKKKISFCLNNKNAVCLW